MSMLFGVLLVFAWIACVPLLARSISALNASPRGAHGLRVHAHKALLVMTAAGYFCIVFLAPFGVDWGVIGGAMVLASRGAASAYAYVAGYVAETSRRIDDAFNVEL